MELNLQLTCSLTGHRPCKLPWGYDENCESFKIFKEKIKIILNQLIDNGIINFLTGMAEGFDMIATEVLINLRNSYPHIKIIAILPCLHQEKLWNKKQQERYKKIISLCDNKIVISQVYTNNCMQKRNAYMVRHSSILFACYDSISNGGTKNTINYAKKQNRKLIFINPNEK